MSVDTDKPVANPTAVLLEEFDGWAVLVNMDTGDIALCGIGRTIPELVYGRLGVDSIRDIWLHHPEILELRRDLDDLDSYPELCRACVHLRSCRTGYVAQKYVESGPLAWPSGMCEKVAQRGEFPVTKKRSLHNTDTKN